MFYPGPYIWSLRADNIDWRTYVKHTLIEASIRTLILVNIVCSSIKCRSLFGEGYPLLRYSFFASPACTFRMLAISCSFSFRLSTVIFQIFLCILLWQTPLEIHCFQYHGDQQTTDKLLSPGKKTLMTLLKPILNLPSHLCPSTSSIGSRGAKFRFFQSFRNNTSNVGRSPVFLILPSFRKQTCIFVREVLTDVLFQW